MIPVYETEHYAVFNTDDVVSVHGSLQSIYRGSFCIADCFEVLYKAGYRPINLESDTGIVICEKMKVIDLSVDISKSIKKDRVICVDGFNVHEINNLLPDYDLIHVHLSRDGQVDLYNRTNNEIRDHSKVSAHFAPDMSFDEFKKKYS